MRPWIVASLWCSLAAPLALAAEPKLALPDSPKIAFVGNTFVERDFQHGYLETRLILANLDKDIVFRNLGWSGDTVRAESRAGFGKPADGFRHLEEYITDLKPNVILVNYGLSEAFAGPAGLDAFNADLATLLDMLSKDKATIVLLGIMKQEKLPLPMPDPAAQNGNIKLYNGALSKAAAARGMQFVDTFDIPDLYAQANPGKTFTYNEIHPMPEAYAFAAEQIAKRLGLPDVKWDDKAEKIRQVTLAKNELWFHRWRPQNETYIFGFRKGEQGKNAVEIPRFDPLIAEKEAEINKLKK
jgi:hypothetical protein